jgi:hypothetical protein
MDAFGLVDRRSYTAIELDSNRMPVNHLEGDDYCGGTWSTAGCGAPLLNEESLRDPMGRIVSVKWRFGHPVFSGGSPSSSNTHPSDWRGYKYTHRGHLSHVF